MDEKIETAIALLEGEAAKSDKPPAMVVMAPDMGESILGNRAGFLRLAIAAVRASQGESQNLDMQPWVCHEDDDWQIRGLSFDEYAHMHLPEKSQHNGKGDGKTSSEFSLSRSSQCALLLDLGRFFTGSLVGPND
jgi:hypothetical protein